MFRRADFQFYATALGLALVLHTCDWVANQAFATWVGKYAHNEIAPVKLKHVAAEPKVDAYLELSDLSRQMLCKRSGECSKMAEALVYEARGESLMGSVAVGYVILERTRNPTRWPKTVRGVVSQKAQFSYLSRRQKTKPSREDWERAFITSYQILHGEVMNPIGNADHYHTLKVRPKWAKKMRYVATIGSHKFYRDAE